MSGVSPTRSTIDGVTLAVKVGMPISARKKTTLTASAPFGAWGLGRGACIFSLPQMPPDYRAARRHLMRCDPKLRDVIKRVGPCKLHAFAPADPFEALCMSIASQQLSVKAADTIFGRFRDLFPDRGPTPEHVMTLTDDQIRGVGFSRPKVSFIKDLASHVIDGRLDLAGLTRHPDE